MALNITAAATTNIGLARAILIQINAVTTGTVTIATLGSTQYGTTAQTMGVIPIGASGEFRYGGLHGQGQITITTSATGDISVTKLNKVM